MCTSKNGGKQDNVALTLRDDFQIAKSGGGCLDVDLQLPGAKRFAFAVVRSMTLLGVALEGTLVGGAALLFAVGALGLWLVVDCLALPIDVITDGVRNPAMCAAGNRACFPGCLPNTHTRTEAPARTLLAMRLWWHWHWHGHGRASQQIIYKYNNKDDSIGTRHAKVNHHVARHCQHRRKHTACGP